MHSDRLLPSGAVDTILAPASASHLQTNVSLGANKPAVVGDTHQASSVVSSAADDKRPPVSHGLSRAAPAASSNSLHPARCPHVQSPPTAKSSWLTDLPPPHMPLGLPSPLQVDDDLSSPSAGAAAASRLIQEAGSLSFNPGSILGLANASANWPGLPTPLNDTSPRLASNAASPPGFSSPSNPLCRLAFGGLNPAVLDDVLSALSSGYPNGATASHASSFAGLGPGPGPGLPAPSLTPTASAESPCKAPPAAPTLPSLEAVAASLDFCSPASPPSPPRDLFPPLVGIDAASLQGLPRPLSAGATAPQRAAFDSVLLLRQQLSFLVQGWMADRESRESRTLLAEQELRRIQAVMDSARKQWTSEKSLLEHQLEMLRAQVHRLQEENAAFKATAAQKASGSGVLSPVAGQQHDGSLHAFTDNPSSSGLNGPTAPTLSSNASQQSSNSRAYIFSLPPSLDGASRRPHFASPGSSRTSPTGGPASSHVAPLDPRTQPRFSAPIDFLAPLAKGGKLPTSIIDVREIDPKLEGIPIKANAVQRSTFSASTGPHPVPVSSVCKNGQSRGAAATHRARRWSPTQNLSMDRGRAPVRRTSSRDQTLQVLAAEESRRLTMHAGHTPNHSLSLVPTMTAATRGDSTGCQSLGSTPSAEAESDGTEQDDAASHGDPDDGAEQGRAAGPDSHLFGETDGAVEGHLEPTDDVALKGPLMIKNISAQDDLFFAKLDQKLESVRRGQDALPSVLRASSSGPEPAPGPSGVPAQHRQSVPAPPIGGDASHDTRSAPENDVGGEADEREMQPEIPLKFKKTSNFGAPFGSL